MHFFGMNGKLPDYQMIRKPLFQIQIMGFRNKGAIGNRLIAM
jgi:hypothetical protein